ncbi:LysR family transcriptional regulator [Haloechinothrix sp. YIM 98757]|uniref:LysR family transcriptional regulator n=1 Tax=Haloechinothrix aidingensis TaxID=2752311 RepID=A0A838A642_9PSEU|nr:LysR substrate-binding domain-containing protein [Haloechinothrix aidingensis]MBA0124265.1 LysR family transcriptional regulator [Haloechinothrix aidingensis]
MTTERILDGRLKIRHLVLVTTIAEHGSIIRAAENLHVTQPVVTRGLHEVEEILDVPLFDRTSRGVSPTIYGDSFISDARAVLARLRHSERQLTQLSNAELGTVTVGTHLAGSNLLLPRAIAALKAERPNLTVVVREATPDALHAALLAGDIDMTVGRLTSTSNGSRVSVEHMYMEPIRLVARRGHAAHELDSPALADLLDYPWILPVDQTALRAELEESFTQEGLDLPADRVECTSLLTLRHLLVSTDVIAALPLLIAEEDDQLEILPTPLRGIRRNVGVTLAADQPLTPAATALLEQLRTEAAQLHESFR